MSTIRCPACDREAKEASSICVDCSCRLDLKEEEAVFLRSERRSQQRVKVYTRLATSVLALVAVLTLFVVVKTSPGNFLWTALITFAVAQIGGRLLAHFLQQPARLRGKYPDFFASR